MGEIGRDGGRKRRGRGKGCGTLEWRTRRGWLARWMVDGKRFSKNLGKITKDEAERRLADITAPFRVRDEIARAEMVQGRIDGARGRLKALENSRQYLLLADAFAAFEKSQERPDTAGAGRLERIRRHIGRLVEFMRDKYPDIAEMRHLTRTHAAAFANDERLAGLRSASYNIVIADCKMIWKVLSTDETAHLEGENPFERIRRKRKVEVRRRELTFDELRRVCGSLTGEMRLLFALGIYTGLRLGDCVNMEWGSIDLKRRIIGVIPSKTKDRHAVRVYIPLHKELYAMLDEIPETDRTGYLFGDGLRDDYGRGRLAWHIRQAFERNGIRTQTAEKVGARVGCIVGFHSLRHSAVSIMANAGVPLAVVQAIVGHSNTEMTRHYFHESAQALENAIMAIPCVWGTGGSDGREKPAYGVLEAFREIVAKMDADGRRAARAILDEMDGRAALPAPSDG